MKSGGKRLAFAEREELILETASLVFSQKGYNGTTTKAVAEKAGINEALIFKHFKSKEAMYTSLLQKKINEKSGKLTKLNFLLKKNSGEKIKEGLFKLAKFIVDENKADPHCMRMMTYSALENHKLGKKFFKQKLPVVDFTESFFRECLKGKANAFDYKIISRMFLSLVYHYIYITQIFQAGDFFQMDEDEALKKFCDFFVSGAVT